MPGPRGARAAVAVPGRPALLLPAGQAPAACEPTEFQPSGILQFYQLIGSGCNSLTLPPVVLKQNVFPPTSYPPNVKVILADLVLFF